MDAEIKESAAGVQLLVTVDTDRYGTVRISGSVTVIAPPVEELFATAAPSTPR